MDFIHSGNRTKARKVLCLKSLSHLSLRLKRVSIKFLDQEEGVAMSHEEKRVEESMDVWRRLTLHGDHIANGPSLKTLMNLVRIQDIILISDNFDAKLMGGVSLGYFF
ncbi:uncharacterized protein LOC130509363 isoform X2 [Raphanus sativus]|uniref:Uncharacterized protein LOC130509363 isoform X2 n=1 Tax=Raphanus sativus TaxID=3726 RepID=A0A9W3DBM4_RAPSA|nr:uncharacterized protein LOC130509363 isoform X2 [Raphanus sativus]XP_056861213.1 uncharacterized protein LOC130509363 isoform X2 [Raphanus sativus]